jgi:hypothetical protein
VRKAASARPRDSCHPARASTDTLIPSAFAIDRLVSALKLLGTPCGEKVGSHSWSSLDFDSKFEAAGTVKVVLGAKVVPRTAAKCTSAFRR